MKLLTKTSLYIATLSLFLFFLMGVIFFQVLKRTSMNDLNRELLELKEAVSGQLASDGNARFPGLDSLSVRSAQGGEIPEPYFRDTLMWDAGSRQFRTYRSITFAASSPEGLQQVTLFKSTTPSDQLVERVTLMMTAMVILFLLGLFLMNRFVFANLWKDFFDVLEKLRQFDSTKEPIQFENQDIEEFTEMKRVLEKMTRQLAADYRELKEYTDHTTHELQTPLAVITSKVELLLQSPQLGAGEMRLIQSISASAAQLSRLNAALTLITRIENRQFTDRIRIPFASLLDRHMEMLQELVELRGIRISKNYGEGEWIEMDEGLADILVANLLKNAVVHNREGGRLEVELDSGLLSVRNEGEDKALGMEVFNRFVRTRRKGSGFGLGLALVRKICDFYGFEVGYEFEQGLHCFTVRFGR